MRTERKSQNQKHKINRSYSIIHINYPNNYYPIILTTCLCKTMERMVKMTSGKKKILYWNIKVDSDITEALSINLLTLNPLSEVALYEDSM